MSNKIYTCGSCQKLACMTGDKDNMPSNCPSLMDNIMDEVKKEYLSDTDSLIAYHSARTKGDASKPLTRLEETIDFAKRCGYKNIGVAFCRMVKNEAGMVAKRLREEGFVVNSVICRCGAISEEFLEKDGETHIYDKKRGKPGYDTMCNPIGQAYILDSVHTEFNVLLGLCVGHDTLFIRHSKVPMTVLGVKDRALGNTPIE